MLQSIIMLDLLATCNISNTKYQTTNPRVHCYIHYELKLIHTNSLAANSGDFLAVDHPFCASSVCNLNPYRMLLLLLLLLGFSLCNNYKSSARSKLNERTQKEIEYCSCKIKEESTLFISCCWYMKKFIIDDL